MKWRTRWPSSYQFDAGILLHAFVMVLQSLTGLGIFRYAPKTTPGDIPRMRFPRSGAVFICRSLYARILPRYCCSSRGLYRIWTFCWKPLPIGDGLRRWKRKIFCMCIILELLLCWIRALRCAHMRIVTSVERRCSLIVSSLVCRLRGIGIDGRQD